MLTTLLVLWYIGIVQSYLPSDDTKRNDDGAFELDEEEQMKLIEDIISSEHYNRKIKPYGNDQLNVSINIYVDTMSDISESSMDYEMTIFFRQFWRDPRLSWGLFNETNYIREDRSHNVDGTMLDMIWMPDIFFVDEKDSKRHEIMTRNMLLEIHPDGEIMLSERLSLKIGCHMDLKFYPFDLQVCPIHVESYAYREDQLNIEWHTNYSIEISNDLTLPTFSLVSNLIRKDCSRKHITGDFSCLEGFFVLRRHISFYLIHIYIPSVLCVIVSWMSFWIKLESAPARVTCGILTFLAISSQTQSFNAELPKVSYIKAIDVWMFVCNLFVFLSLMEYAFAQVLLRREEKKIEYMRVRRASMDTVIPNTPSMHKNHENGHLTQRRITDTKSLEQGKTNGRRSSCSSSYKYTEPSTESPENIDEIIRQKEHILKGLSGLSIDHMSRKAFPIAFAIFNIFYWAICCSVPKEDLPDDCIIQPINTQ